MLSAAHVLAMDAKNLLDVVDSVRIRYPELFTVESTLNINNTTYKPCEESDEFHLKNTDESDAEKIPTKNLSSFPNVNSSAGAFNFSEDSVEHHQTYQNLCKSSEQASPSFSDEIYVNQLEPIINTTEGIYDNECIVNAQMKVLNIDSKIANSSANTLSTHQSNKIAPPIASAKPPLAAKPGTIAVLNCETESNEFYLSFIL